MKKTDIPLGNTFLTMALQLQLGNSKRKFMTLNESTESFFQKMVEAELKKVRKRKAIARYSSIAGRPLLLG